MDATDGIKELANLSELHFEVVETILDIGEASDGLFFQVQWEGLPNESNGTWRKCQDLFQDVPDMSNDSFTVKDLLSSFKSKEKL